MYLSPKLSKLTSYPTALEHFVSHSLWFYRWINNRMMEHSQAELKFQFKHECSGFTVISFHSQIVPSQIVPINSQIVPQNGQFVPQKSQFVPHMKSQVNFSNLLSVEKKNVSFIPQADKIIILTKPKSFENKQVTISEAPKHVVEAVETWALSGFPSHFYCNVRTFPLTLSNFCFPSDHFYTILPSITRTML